MEVGAWARRCGSWLRIAARSVAMRVAKEVGLRCAEPIYRNGRVSWGGVP